MEHLELKNAVSGGKPRLVYRKNNRIRIRNFTKPNYRIQNILIALLVALFLFIIDSVSILFFDFDSLEISFLITTSLLVYLALLFFLMQYTKGRTFVKGTEGVPELNISQIISKDSGKKKEMQVEIKKPAFIGSMLSKTYHLPTCRLARLIKPRYKLEDNNLLFFQKKKFKACKICIKSKKKSVKKRKR